MSHSWYSGSYFGGRARFFQRTTRLLAVERVVVLSKFAPFWRSLVCYPACASTISRPILLELGIWSTGVVFRWVWEIQQHNTSRIRARNHYSNQNSSSCCLSSTLPSVKQRTDKKHCHKTEVSALSCLLSTSPLPHLSSLERSTIEFQRIVAIGTFGSIREPFLPKPLQSSLPKQSLAAYTYPIRSTK